MDGPWRSNRDGTCAGSGGEGIREQHQRHGRAGIGACLSEGPEGMTDISRNSTTDRAARRNRGRGLRILALGIYLAMGVGLVLHLMHAGQHEAHEVGAVFHWLRDAALAEGYQVMVGCMVGSSLAMAPATLVAQGARVTDLDGPLLLAEDRDNALDYDMLGVHPPKSALWG